MPPAAALSSSSATHGGGSVVLSPSSASSLSASLSSLPAEALYAAISGWLSAASRPVESSSSNSKKRRRRGEQEAAAPLLSVDCVTAAASACVRLLRAEQGAAEQGAAPPACSGRGPRCQSAACSLRLLLLSNCVSLSCCPSLLPALLSALPSQPLLLSSALLHVHDWTEQQLVTAVSAALDCRAQERRRGGQAVGTGRPQPLRPLAMDALMSASRRPPAAVSRVCRAV